MNEEHLPMKDEFSGDESEIDILEKEEDAVQPDGFKIKRIKKKHKNFIWKLKWVPINNSVDRSQPLFVKRWVKIKMEGWTN